MSRTILKLTGSAHDALKSFDRVIVGRGRGRGGSVLIAGTNLSAGISKSVMNDRKNTSSVTLNARLAQNLGINGEYVVEASKQSLPGASGPTFVVKAVKRKSDVPVVRAYSKKS